MGAQGRVQMVLHSIAFGNLKLIAPENASARGGATALAKKLGVEPEALIAAADELFAEGEEELHGVTSAAQYPDRSYLDEDDFARTILSMGTSLLGWVQGAFAQGVLADDARVFGLTSEGNEVAWKGYAAVSAAKVALEALSRSIAVEFGAHGIRSNVIQAGVTETPALAAIPGQRPPEGAGGAAQSARSPDDAARRRTGDLPPARSPLRAGSTARSFASTAVSTSRGPRGDAPAPRSRALPSRSNEITNALPRRARHRHERRVDPGARRNPLAPYEFAARLHQEDSQPRSARGARSRDHLERPDRERRPCGWPSSARGSNCRTWVC